MLEWAIEASFLEKKIEKLSSALMHYATKDLICEGGPCESMNADGENTCEWPKCSEARYIKGPQEACDALGITGVHWSDCALHNMPAMPNGPCSCGANAPKS